MTALIPVCPHGLSSRCPDCLQAQVDELGAQNERLSLKVTQLRRTLRDRERKLKEPIRLIEPLANCPSCQGRGTMLYADSFDRDNGMPCPVCEKRAKKLGAKLVNLYPR